MLPMENYDGMEVHKDLSRPFRLRTSKASDWDALTPEQYVTAVAEHANTSAANTIYPGSNYENLASYLQQPQKNNSTNTASASKYLPEEGQFASLVPIGKAGFEPVERFQDVDDFIRGRKSETSATSKSSLLFLHGFPSPEWLAVIGSTFGLDPEFFQRHLDFRSTTGKVDYYPLPSLPSSSSNIIRVRLTTLGAWSHSLGKRYHQKELDALRRSCAQSMGNYKHEIRLNYSHRINTGDSIVRSFDVIDGMNFAIEQEASACISWSGDKFTIIIWLDSGQSIDEGLAGPWTESVVHQRTSGIHLFPVIQHHPGMALQSSTKSANIRETEEHLADFSQSFSILETEYGALLDIDGIATNPFYALTELLQLAAYSECQFLNMMESKLSSGTNHLPYPQENPPLTNLLYFKEILESHAQRNRDALTCIRKRGGPEWHTPLQAESPIVEAFTSQILQDHEYLLVRAELLVARCHQNMDVIMNRAIIAESEKAIQQNKELAKLTRLAFFFIPLSFTASFLGMNIQQFGNGSLELWIWFALSVPVFGMSILVLYLDVAKYGKQILNWLVHRI